MLNPYVPGNAGSTSATSKKGKPSGDPLNDMSYMDDRSAGPVEQLMSKPAITTQPPSTTMPKPTGFPAAPVVPQVQAPAGNYNMSTGAIQGVASGPAGGTGLTQLPQFQFSEDRLNNMLGSNSTYMQQARRAGTNAAVGRGGINSSIAGGFAQAQAIDRAAPIAMADAQFTQEDYLTGRRALLDDIRSGNDSGRRMSEDTLRSNLQDQLAGNENVRTMGRMNLESDLTGQRDRNLSTLRRTEMQFETELSDQLRNNDTQREAWLSQQTNLSQAYAQSLTNANNTNLSFISRLGDAFINDPELYDDEFVGGMTNFFNQLTTGVGNQASANILRNLMAAGGVATQPVERPQPLPTPGGI